MNFLFDGPDDSSDIVILAHGAGGPMDSPFMAKVARGLGENGILAARFEFPYMAARREGGRHRPPDREPQLRASWRAVIDSFQPRGVIIGGKSLGGRMASMETDHAGVRGLVCLGYPFHPPGKRDQLRTAHLSQITKPALIVQGSRDPFGSAEDVAGYALPEAIRMVWIPEGDHSLKSPARSGRTEAENLAFAVESVVEFVRGLE